MQIKLIDKLTGDSTQDLEFLKSILDELPDTAENYELRTTALQLLAQIKDGDANYSKKISIEKINSYITEKNFNECISYIDSILSNLPIELEKDNKAQYRFRDIMEFCLFTEISEGNNSYEWVDNYDAFILEKKVFCLFELKKYDDAKTLCELIEKLNPLNFNNSMELAELYKAQGDFEKFKEKLDQISKTTWRSTDLARLMRAYGYYYIEKEDFEKAMSCLDVSRAYDSSERSIAYINNEIGYIKLKCPDIKVLPPHENLKFLNDNNMFYTPTHEFKVKLMRTYKALLNIMKENNNIANVCATFATNFLTITMGEQELLDLVEADTLRDKALVINKKFGFSFEVSREWNEMNDEGKEKFNLAKNTACFLFVAANNKLEKTISITHDTTFNPRNEEEFQNLIDGNIKALKEHDYSVEENGILEFANGLRVYRFLVSNGQIDIVQYFFKMRPDLLGCLSYKKEQENELRNEVLNIFNTYNYLGFKRDSRTFFMRNFYIKLKVARKNNQDYSEHLSTLSNNIKMLFTARLNNPYTVYIEELIRSAIYLICTREGTVEEVTYQDLREFLSLSTDETLGEKFSSLISTLINKSEGNFPILQELQNKTESEKLEVYALLANVLK